MNRKFLIWFLVLIFGLVSSGFVNGAVIDEDGMINVVIKLRDNLPQDNAKILNYNKNNYINLNREMVINRMGGNKEKIGSFSENKNDFKVGYKYSNVNGFSAKVSLEKFEALKKDIDVESVEFAKVYFPLLDVSAPQIGANNVWDLQIDEVNLNGTGQSICVIDTGVNYNHSALGGAWGNKVIAGYKFVNNGDNESCSVNNSACYDVEGHGTHVSGIIASENLMYKGIASDSKIVIMQVFSGGSAWSSDIARAIDWCVDNKDTYNISVISMSLGDNSTHNTYCNEDCLADFINVAVFNNITVVVAAGNCELPDQPSCIVGVASPACVESVIIAGAVNDVDNIWYMRGALLEIMAPGLNIMSSVIGGGFNNMGGTSMSAPHIAGAVALINQYLSLSGQSKTPSEIEIILNNTGKVLDDSSGSGYNFSRINTYSAILSLDVDAPNVTLVSPFDDEISLMENQTFICNATDWQLSNVTLKIWNSTELYYNTTKNLTGTVNGTSFDLDNMSLGTYSWNCFVIDAEGNLGNATNYTLTIGEIFVNLTSPSNNTYTNINKTNFTCNLTSEENYELSNVTFYLWNSSVLVRNETKNISGTNNQSIFSYNFTEEGNYFWNCFGVNNVSYNSSAENNRTITYDVTTPNISEVDANPVSSSGTTIIWTTENDSSNSSVSVSGGTWNNLSDYTISHSIVVSGLSASTNYNYTVTSCDEAGNCNSSVEKSFTTIASPPPAPSGGGGGSSTIRIYSITNAEMFAGHSVEMKKNNKINFELASGKHSMKTLKVESNSVDVLIESEPVYLTLITGEEIKLNLSLPDYYDFYIKLNSIKYGKANISVMRIFEEIAKKIEVIENSEENKTYHTMENKTVTNEIDETKNYFWIVSGLIFVICVTILLIIKITKKLKREELIKKEGKKHGKKRKKAKT